MEESKSIIVPSVQELAKSHLERVPDRYIRPFNDDDTPIIPNNDDHDHSAENLQVPVINMEALLSGDQQELQRLHSACQHWGFFQVVNHGVKTSLLEKVKTEISEIFRLPMEEKKKYWQTSTDMEGFGQVFVVSDEQKLEWGDIFLLLTLPEHQRSRRLMPLLPPSFRETIENYSRELRGLMERLIECFGKALNVDVEVMKRIILGDEGKQTLRMNYYPPCPEPEKVIGIAPHSDGTSLTVLLQLNDVAGLQIMKDGKWVLVEPIPNAFVVNVGDMLEMATNGLYRSILHRGVVNKTKERLSIAAFHTPRDGQEIGPLPCLISPEFQAKFKTINVTDFLKGMFARKLDGKSYIDVMRIDKSA